MAVAFACYHARFALGVRNAVYRRIVGMLSRKHNGGPDPLLSNPDVRHHLRRAAAQNRPDLVCFISTTNILEAGSDLDADWGVTEPCSERSVIQFAGRLRRHRPWAHMAINLGILQSPVPRTGPEQHRLARPGVETPVVMPPCAAGEVFSPLGVKAEVPGIFPMDRWSVRIDATSCLLDLPSPCADAEVAMLEAVCLGAETALGRLRPTSGTRQSLISFESRTIAALSVKGLVSNPAWLWTDLFPKWRRFRRQDPKREDVEIRLEKGSWWMRDDACRRRANETSDNRSAQSSWYAPPADRLRLAQPSLCGNTVACEPLLLPATAYNVEHAASNIEEKSAVAGMAVEHWMSREIRTTSLSLYKNSGSHVVYDPWLGMDRGSG
jgi:hypothetical protein